MPDKVKVEDRAQAMLEEMWAFAREACHTTVRSYPDLIVVLYHSGQCVLHATQAAWQTAFGPFFPPVLGINIGREKVATFRHQMKITNHEFMRFHCWFPPAEEELSAWVERRQALQDQLREQVTAALGRETPPASVLILDDIIALGWTMRLAEKLITTSYPGIDARFLAGSLFNWQDALGLWCLLQHHPDLLGPRDGETGEPSLPKELSYALQCHLGRVVVGSEDAARGSLMWRPLTPQNKHVKALAAHLPLDVVMSLSEEVYAMITDYVSNKAADAEVWLEPGPSQLIDSIL